MSTNATTRLRTLAGVLAATAALAACGNGSSGAAAPTAPAPSASATVGTEHNEADIRFAQGMIPHHQQAVEMADLAVDRSENQEVLDLAERIRTAQDPEIATLTGLLRAWGAPAPDMSMGGMDHGTMDHGDMGQDDASQGGMDHGGMAGMATPAQMEQLGTLTGAGFDTLFLQLMVAHHEGAVVDAQRVLAEGVNPQAKELAAQIVDAQSAEITQMQGLLATL